MAQIKFTKTAKQLGFVKKIKITTAYDMEVLEVYFELLSCINNVIVAVIGKTIVTSGIMDHPDEESIIDFVADAIRVKGNNNLTRINDLKIDFSDLVETGITCVLWVRLGEEANE